MRYCSFGFHKMQSISWLVEERVASQEGPWSTEIVISDIFLSFFVLTTVVFQVIASF
jgi:hypothetical protein